MKINISFLKSKTCGFCSDAGVSLYVWQALYSLQRAFISAPGHSSERGVILWGWRHWGRGSGGDSLPQGAWVPERVGNLPRFRVCSSCFYWFPATGRSHHLIWSEAPPPSCWLEVVLTMHQHQVVSLTPKPGLWPSGQESAGCWEAGKRPALEGWCRGHWDLGSEGGQDPRGQWLAQTWLALGIMSPARCYKWGNGGWERGLASLGSQSRSMCEAAFGPTGPATFVSVLGQGACRVFSPNPQTKKPFSGTHST